jgi:site-specific recombinase XerD
LRQRLIDDMRLRNLSPKTIEAYVGAVARFARHFGRSPDQLGAAEVRAYQVHLLQRALSWSLIHQVVSGLRFFYRITLGRSDVIEHLTYAKRPSRLPSVLSHDEVARLLAAVADERLRLLLRTAYACGLRVSEAARLQVGDIDSARGVLHIRQGKGQRDRLVPLSGMLLEELRAYWRRHRPRPWLFPGHSGTQPVAVRVVQGACRAAVRQCGLSKRVTPHTLRHSYATHVREAGGDLATLQELLGHRDLRTTLRYVHLAAKARSMSSPLDALPISSAER